MITKITKATFALLHFLLIKEVLNPTDAILWVMLVYTIFAIIVSLIDLKERHQKSTRFLNREI